MYSSSSSSSSAACWLLGAQAPQHQDADIQTPCCIVRMLQEGVRNAAGGTGLSSTSPLPCVGYEGTITAAHAPVCTSAAESAAELSKSTSLMWHWLCCWVCLCCHMLHPPTYRRHRNNIQRCACTQGVQKAQSCALFGPGPKRRGCNAVMCTQPLAMCRRQYHTGASLRPTRESEMTLRGQALSVS
jgi:hypothetical protein